MRIQTTTKSAQKSAQKPARAAERPSGRDKAKRANAMETTAEKVKAVVSSGLKNIMKEKEESVRNSTAEEKKWRSVIQEGFKKMTNATH